MQLIPWIHVMWYWGGQQRRSPTPGTHVTRARFWALKMRPGQWVDLVRERMRAAALLVNLEHLLVAYPAWPIPRIEDYCSCRAAHAVDEWMAVHLRSPLTPCPRPVRL